MKSWKWMLCLGVTSALTIASCKPGYAFIPTENQMLKPETMMKEKGQEPAYDLWGRTFLQKETHEFFKTAKGRALLSPQNGAVKIDQALFDLGRKSFYEETFGNEVFLTDIIGAFNNGPLTIENLQKAAKELNGQGTTNLRVELAETVTIGEKTFKKGTKIETGLDVAKGSNEVLGIPIMRSEGRLKVGLSCASCHATVDPVHKLVIEGAVNSDADFGLLLALGTNTSAYFGRTEVTTLKN